MPSDAALADSETAALDRAVDELAAGAKQWRELSLVAKRDLLREVGRRISVQAADWVAAGCAGRGVSPGASVAGEEWVSGPWVTLAYCNALAATVDALARGRTRCAVCGCGATRGMGRSLLTSCRMSGSTGS